jgi:hypothetical protein
MRQFDRQKQSHHFPFIANLSTGAHLGGREQAPDVGTSLAAGLADEQRLDVGEPDMVRPPIGAHLNRVAASEVGAIDQEAVDAGGAHLAKGDFLLAGGFGHAP